MQYNYISYLLTVLLLSFSFFVQAQNRVISLGISIDSQGTWSNGETLWVADNLGDRIYAYNVSDISNGNITRDSDKDIVLAKASPGNPANNNPRGIWSDGTTMWVAQRSFIFAYPLELPEGSDPDDPRARVTTKEFKLAGGNNNSQGIWSDGSTLWVVDFFAGRIFAYDLNMPMADGTLMRDTNKEIILPTANRHPRGIWSDSTTMWVADSSDRHIYAYNLKTRKPHSSRAFTLPRVNGVVENGFPYGLESGDKGTLWVLDNRDSSIYTYTLPTGTPPPILTGVSIAGIPLAEIPAGVILTNNPVYIFTSTEAGELNYDGTCASSSNTEAETRDEGTITYTVTFNGLADGTTYTDCTITVTDATGDNSEPLAVPAFTVETTAPHLTGISLAGIPLADMPELPIMTNENTLEYIFKSDEAGTISYSADCTSSTTPTTAPVKVGTNTVTFSTLAEGEYTNCTITVTDAAGNAPELAVPAFTVDTTPPRLSEIRAIPILTNDTDPDYTFASDEAGRITYGGNCIGRLEEATASRNNHINFRHLEDGEYSDCTIIVTDPAGNPSDPLKVRTFTIEAVAPRLTGLEIAGIPLADMSELPIITMDTTPKYTFRSTEVGKITYGGVCSSTTGTATATIGAVSTEVQLTDNTITFEELAEGQYGQDGDFECTITVTDAAGNDSNTLTVSDFTIDTTAPRLTGLELAGILLADMPELPIMTNDNTPEYIFTSTEAGAITVGGDCSSPTTRATVDVNVIAFNPLADGEYTNCTIIVTDQAGNNSDPLAVAAFTIDTIEPIVMIDNVPATTSGDFTVAIKFSEVVTGFTKADITQTGIMVAGGMVSALIGSGSSYTATITPANSLSDMNIIDIDIAAGVTSDLAGNANVAAAQRSVIFATTDTINPELSSIRRMPRSNGFTNADMLIWEVVFSERVNNVDDTDFSLTATVDGMAIDVGSVTLAVAGNDGDLTYQVTASGGSLATANGEVRLSIVSANNITDTVVVLPNGLASITPTGDDESYTLDNTAPTVMIDADPPATTSGAFTVNINFIEGVTGVAEDVTGFALEDIMVGVGSGTASDFDVVSGSSYTAIITPDASLSDGDTITIDIAADAAMDLASNGNEAAAVQVTVSFTPVDTTPPHVERILRMTPSVPVTNSGTLTWQLVFDEGVKNVDATDFILDFSPTDASTEILDVSRVDLAVTAGNDGDTSYQVTASGGNLKDLDGEVRLSIISMDHEIMNLAGINLIDPAPTDDDQFYTLDNTAPTVESIRRFDPSDEIINSGTLTWELTFIEPVTTGTNGFSLAGTNDATLLSAVASDDTGTTYRVTASGGDLEGLDGEVTLRIDAETSITDEAGNSPAAQDFSNHSYTLDNTAPTPIVTIEGTSARVSGTFTVNINFIEVVTGVAEDVTGFALEDIMVGVGNGTASDFMGMGSSYTATITPDASLSDGDTITIDIAAGAAMDLAGNGNEAADQVTVSFTIADTTPPEIQDISRSGMPPLAEVTNSGTLTWQLVFDEGVKNVDATDFILDFSPTDASTEILDVSRVDLAVTAGNDGDTSYQVMASGGDLATVNGKVRLVILAGNDITDTAVVPNALANIIPNDDNDSYTLDNTAPTVESIRRFDPSDEIINSGTLTWELTFIEPVTTGTNGFSLAGTNDATLLSAVASDDTGTTYRVTASGGDLEGLDGEVTLRIDAETSITDEAGNSPAAQDFSNHSYTLDNTAPTPIITIEGTSARVSGTFTVNINFIEVVTGVAEDVTGFALEDIMVGVGNGTASDFMGMGSSYTVTITPDASLSDGDTITIDIAAGAAMDLAGNGNEAADQVTVSFTIADTTPPEIQDISRSGMPPLAEVTNSGTLTWQLVFYEGVKNVDATDFILDFSPTDASTEILDVSRVDLAVTAGNDGDTSYQVTASGGDLATVNGKVRLVILAGNDITDTAVVPNALANIIPNDDNDSYTLDNTAPTVESIRRFDPSDEIINSGTLTWELTFIEPVTTGTNGFSLAGTNDATLLSAVASDDTGTTYRVTASGGDLEGLDGEVTLRIDAETSITDEAGNSPADHDFSNHSYTLDNTPPTLTGVALAGVELADLPMPILINSNPPQYTFRSNEAGRFQYLGDCSSETGTVTATIDIVPPDTAVQPTDNTIAFDTLEEGIVYTNCTVTVTDAANNDSDELMVPAFTIDTIMPTVGTITTTAAAGSYGIGQTVAIQVEFTEPVVVVTRSGTPVLSLNNGGQAVYTGISGSSTLTFNYKVSAGEGIASLDVLNDDALTLAGATIKDLFGNEAMPSLASTDTSGLNDIRISTPGVIGVSGADGHYRAGDEVTIRVQFSESVTISGGTALQLQLETGDVDRIATFSELTTTNREIPNDTLDFIYRVEEGDRSRDLAYTSPNALVETDGTRVTGVASGLTATDLRADLGANLGAILTLPALNSENSLAGSSNIVIGIAIEGQNTRLNEMLLPKIVQTISVATVDAITRRIESGGGDGQAVASSSLSGILPAGLPSLKDLDLSDLSWLKSFAYDFLIAKAEQSVRSGSVDIGLDSVLGSGFDIKRVLADSEFVIPLNASGGDSTGSGVTSDMVLWGNGNYSNLSDNDDGLDYDGDIYSINLGIDSQINQETLLGISVNWSNSNFDYRDATTVQTGDYGYKLYGINPYISWSPQGLGGANLWATLGYGIGEIENQIEGIEKVETDTRQYQFSGGGRYILSSSADQLSQLSIKGDMTLLRVDIERSAGFFASDIDSQSFRLLLQGSSVFNYADYSFTPSLEGGLRYDLGDGDTGGGIELSPAFTYKSLDDHILIEGRGRYLIAGQHDQWGLSVLARIDQARHGRGLSFSMHPTWGQSQAQAEQLTAHNGSRFNDYRETKAEAQMKTELSYGMHMSHILGQTMLFTPYAEFTLGENARYYQFGQRLSIGELLSLSFKLSHHQRRGYADDNHLGLESAINF